MVHKQSYRRNTCLAVCVVWVVAAYVAAPARGDALSDWKHVQQRIVERRLKPIHLETLSGVVADEAAVAQIGVLIRSEPSADDDEAWDAVYETFLRGLPVSDVLYAFLDEGVSEMFDADKARERSIYDRAGYYAWHWGPWGCAAVNGYRATGEKRYIELVTTTFDRLLELRDDRTQRIDETRGRVLASWSSARFGDPPIRGTKVTYAGLIVLPVTELLVLAGRDEVARGILGERFNEYREAIDETLWAFEADYRTMPGCFYAERAGYYLDPFTDTVEALNHTHVLGAAMVNMYALTGDVRYSTRVRELLDFFRQSVTVQENGTWSWPYAPTPQHMRARKGEPFWKASITNLFTVAAYRHDLSITSADVESIADALLKNVYREGKDLNCFISQAKVREVDADFPKSQSSYLDLLTWTVLDEVRPEIRERAFRQMVEHPDRFPVGWFRGSRFGVYALSHIMAHPAGAVSADHRDDVLAVPEAAVEPVELLPAAGR